MDLRPRKKQPFTGFTEAEVTRMEQLLDESKGQPIDEEYCKKLTRVFNRSSGRAGKPVLKWIEIQSWFQKNQLSNTKNNGMDAAKDVPAVPETHAANTLPGNSEMPEGDKDRGDHRLEFEARSSKDMAWYDIDTFRAHRFLSSGVIEFLVRYVGFGADEDEWVNAKTSVRVRSVPVEHTECDELEAGDPIVCFQERQDQSRYYDAHITDVERRMHDMRGCRCIFSIKYDHDDTVEKVRLRRLCHRPSTIAETQRS